jgi:hypothetical protein
MNCEQFRTLLLLDPSAANLTPHVGHCEPCAMALARMRRCEGCLVEVIQAVHNPALVNRVLMIPQQRRSPRRRVLGWTLALAASVAILAFGSRFYIEPSDANGWGELVLAHIDDNPHEFYAEAAPQPMAQQSALLSEVGVSPSLLGDLHAIRSDRCKMKRTLAVHTMVETADAQGVLFLLPKNVGETQMSTPDRFAVLTTRQDKTVAVVARSRREAELILASLDRI